MIAKKYCITYMLSLALILGVPILGTASANCESMIKIHKPWVRAIVPHAQTQAAYFTIENKGTTEQKIIGSSSPQFRAVEIHTTIHAENRVSMQRLPILNIPAQSSVVFQPRSTHMMLIQPTTTIKQQGTITITLDFESGMQCSYDFPIARSAP